MHTSRLRKLAAVATALRRECALGRTLFLRSIRQDAPVTRLVGLGEFYRRTGGRESLLYKLGRQIPCRLRRKNVQKF